MADPSAPRFENRLAVEASPYLRQHGHNPVDWFPWGKEALERSRQKDKPILLSIGYSACHWCHVMERESFEDESDRAPHERALRLNVKVDREERPDLDQVYQLVVQLMGRSGGWPLTVFLTPEQKPFFGGTYFPPEDRHGMPGFPKILRAIADAYATRRSDVDLQARELSDAIGRIALGEGRAEEAVGPDLLERAANDARIEVRRRARRLRDAPQVPEHDAARGAAPARSRGRRHTRRGTREARPRRDAHGRHLRSARRWLPPLLDRREVARAALREDALRQRAPLASLRRRLPRIRRCALRRHGARASRAT
jgi:uncharacterized protein YyaL (SSP411 family)